MGSTSAVATNTAEAEDFTNENEKILSIREKYSAQKVTKINAKDIPLYEVKKDGLSAIVLDRTMVLPFCFSSIEYYDDFFIGTLEDKTTKGVFKLSGRVMIPAKYSFIEFVNGFFMASEEEDGPFKVFDCLGHELKRDYNVVSYKPFSMNGKLGITIRSGEGDQSNLYKFTF